MTTLVIGASGGLGAALADAAGEGVVRLSRRSEPSLDLRDEASIAAAAAHFPPGSLRRVILATGFLHDERFTPEKAMRQLDAAHMAQSFTLNTIGPALVMKHFLPRLRREGRAVFAVLSARVGSIGDNRLGGWWSYRASKAALNQCVRNAAIEAARSHREAVVVAIHPGTVATGLSGPFAKAGLEVQTPAEAAVRILAVLEGLTPEQSGGFFDHLGKAVPW